MIRLGLLKFKVLIPALVTPVFAAVVFGLKNTPNSATELNPLPIEAFGVLRHDRQTSSAGINVMTSYVDNTNCQVFDNDGKIFGEIPGQFCGFLPGKGLVSIQGPHLALFDAEAKKVWSRTLEDPHHDLTVSIERAEIVALDKIMFDINPEVTKVVSNEIFVFDGDGNEKFHWSEKENLGVLAELIAPRDPLTKPFRPEIYNFEFGHINSVQIIPEGFIQTWGPAFRSGNLLVSFGEWELLAVIERPSGKIVWSFREEGYRGIVHSPRLTPDGQIVYFKNHSSAKETNTQYRRSEIALIGPGDTAPNWSFSASRPNLFYSDPYGHVEALPNGNFLVTDNPQGGRAFEVTREKKIVWEWTREAIGGERPQVYQVVRFPLGVAEEFLSLLR